MSYWGLFFLIILPGIIGASPLEQSFVRVQRQSEGCQVQSDCLSPTAQNVTTDFVNCVAGQCVCNDCFFLQAGMCSTCTDYPYGGIALACGQDNRPKQLTALLLTIFVSSTGAANFYIGQNNLGGGQLFLLFFTFAISYFMCCFPCCLACCMDEPKKSGIFICIQLLAALLTALTALCTISWWIADLVIFAQNDRLSGNGCVLKSI